MNKLRGTITAVESADHLSIVDVEVGGVTLSSIVLETPETTSYLRAGHAIDVVFKESTVSIGKNLSGLLSQRNRLEARITVVEEGKILTRLVLDFHGATVVSLITTRSANSMAIKAGDIVQAVIKSSDIALMEILPDEL